MGEFSGAKPEVIIKAVKKAFMGKSKSVIKPHFPLNFLNYVFLFLFLLPSNNESHPVWVKTRYRSRGSLHNCYSVKVLTI
jgi:hypothetical protein